MVIIIHDLESACLVCLSCDSFPSISIVLWDCIVEMLKVNRISINYSCIFILTYEHYSTLLTFLQNLFVRNSPKLEAHTSIIEQLRLIIKVE